jgi:hypothetical protein
MQTQSNIPSPHRDLNYYFISIWVVMPQISQPYPIRSVILTPQSIIAMKNDKNNI